MQNGDPQTIWRNIPPRRTADAIHCIITGLKQRRDRLGVEKAFDPGDPETNFAFGALWAVSFDQKFPREQQDAILREMKTHHPESLAAMREISIESEKEMEKGFCRQSIAKAEAAQRPEGVGKTLAERVHKWRYWLGSGEEDKQACRETLTRLMNEQAGEIIRYTLPFPYHTYQALSHGEENMVAALDGRGMNAQAHGMHLVIEAGALPFTALYSSISRVGGEVIATISDQESYDLAKTFVGEMERLGIIESNKIHLVHTTPEQVKNLKFTNAKGEEVVPYSATVTQLVQPAARTEATIRALKERGMDTVVARGANGLTTLLYEPLDDIRLPPGWKPKFVAVPAFATVTQAQRKAEGDAVHRRHLCYNTSHVFSSRQIDRTVQLPSDNEYLFESAGRAK